jgi:hypothetical protein
MAKQRVQVWDAHGGVHLFRRLRVKLNQTTRDGGRELYLQSPPPQSLGQMGGRVLLQALDAGNRVLASLQYISIRK